MIWNFVVFTGKSIVVALCILFWMAIVFGLIAALATCIVMVVEEVKDYKFNKKNRLIERISDAKYFLAFSRKAPITRDKLVEKALNILVGKYDKDDLYHID